MKKRILSSIGIIIYGLFVINLLHNWFPNPGPGTIGTTPITVVIAIILAIINFIIITKISGNKRLLIYGITLIMSFSIIAINLYPQEKPLTQIKTAIYLWLNPDEIKYEDLFRLNYQKESIYVTAALVKFQDTIPEQAFTITYCCEKPVKKYFIAKYEHQFITNNQELIINHLSKDSIEFKDEFHGEKVKFISPTDIFGSKEGWGTYINLDTKKNNIFFKKCELKPIEGFNSIYFKLIN